MRGTKILIAAAGAAAWLSGCSSDSSSSWQPTNQDAASELDSAADIEASTPKEAGADASDASAAPDVVETGSDVAPESSVDGSIDAASEALEDAKHEPTGEGHCAMPLVIGCDQTINGNTATAEIDAFHEYPDCMLGTNLDGPEKVYKLEGTQDYESVGITLNPGSNQFAWVLDDACDASACIASTAGSFVTKPGHNYYVVVDSTTSNSGPFTLKTSCSIPDLCMGWSSGPICPSAYMGVSNEYEANAMQHYDCAPGVQEPGDEFVWEMKFNEPTTITATLQTPAGVNLDLFLLKGICHPTTCEAASVDPTPGAQESLVFTLNPGERGLLVVDNTDGWVGSFDLLFSCTTP